MRVKELYLKNFRIFKEIRLSFSDKTILLGPNASGKTTIIEAINYCSTFSPLRSYETDRNMVRVGESNFNILLSLEENLVEKTIFVGYEIRDGEPLKKIKINDKNSSVINASGILKSIPFLIEDYELVIGSPSYRRRYVDSVLISISPSYYHHLINYHKILKQKNLVLKKLKEMEGDINYSKLLEQTVELVKTYNKILSKHLIEITKCRYEFCSYIDSNLSKKFDFDLKVKYKSSLLNSDNILFSTEESVIDLMNREINKEILYGKSLIGPHLDDFIFVTGGQIAKGFLSQGQIRTLSILFKLICADYVRVKSNVMPVLLIDDIFGELDEINKNKVLEKILYPGYQIIMAKFEVHQRDIFKDFDIIEIKNFV
ncbi:MAG: DNA replication and repair protein RecF [Brevinematales bacterium]|nr:DNA replication and repair protein RecF [Brevinematales bacterium]